MIQPLHSTLRHGLLAPGVIAASLASVACVAHVETPAPRLAASQDHVAASREQDDLRAVAADMAAAARALVASLDEAQQAKIGLSMDEEERLNWHFVPRARKGLPLKEMSEQQRDLVHALLKSALTDRGHYDAVQIIELETVLRKLGGGPHRDPELYFVTVFGKPDPAGTWGWRFEGHHLSLNFTIVEGRFVAGAPSFFGANPARHAEDDGERRVLAPEEDFGRAFMKSLPPDQQAIALISERPFGDIVTGASREVDIGDPQGLAFSQVPEDQQRMLQKLVSHYAHRLRGELARQDLSAIEAAGWDKVYFAWAGSIEPGAGHYYRLHGPTFLVEYDNTQNRANHIHTAWRDLENDFGRDLLREHYEAHRTDAAHGHDE